MRPRGPICSVSRLQLILPARGSSQAKGSGEPAHRDLNIADDGIHDPRYVGQHPALMNCVNVGKRDSLQRMELKFLPRYLLKLIKMQRQSFCSNSEIWGSYAPFSILSKTNFLSRSNSSSNKIQIKHLYHKTYVA